jgi:hypothetical protein
VILRHLGCPEQEAVVDACALAAAWRRDDGGVAARSRVRDRGKLRAALCRAGKHFAQTAAGDPFRLGMAVELYVEARMLPRGRAGAPPSREVAVLWPALGLLWRRVKGRVPHSRSGPFVAFVKDVHMALSLPGPRGEAVADAAPDLNPSAELRGGDAAQLAALRDLYGR